MNVLCCSEHAQTIYFSRVHEYLYQNGTKAAVIVDAIIVLVQASDGSK
jgi:hypothetical protein